MDGGQSAKRIKLGDGKVANVKKKSAGKKSKDQNPSGVHKSPAKEKNKKREVFGNNRLQINNNESSLTRQAQNTCDNIEAVSKGSKLLNESEDGTLSKKINSNAENEERRNVGFSDDGALANCWVGNDFWWGEKSSKLTKFFIRLHTDGENSEGTQQLVFIEKIGVNHPQTRRLTLSQLHSHILRYYSGATVSKSSSSSDDSSSNNNNSSVIIWLDIRDLDYFLSASFWKFLAVFAHSITHLSMGGKLREGTNTVVAESVFMEFLFDRIPHIEYLALNDEQFFKVDGPFSPEGVRPLEKLKTIRFVNTCFSLTESFIQHILQPSVTPNLQNIFALPLKFLSLVKKKSGKFSQLKSMDFSSNQWKSVKEFSQDLIQLSLLHSSQRELEELRSPVYMRLNGQLNRGKNIDFDMLVKELFECHQRTLKKLTIEPVPRYFTYNVPVLERVETLEFNLWLIPAGYHPIYPDGTDLREIFPNVSTVILNFSSDWDGNNISTSKNAKNKDPLSLFQNCFPVDWNSFKAVRCLKLVSCVPTECVEELADLFQNIKLLKVRCDIPKLCKILPYCLHFWKELEEIILEIEFNGGADSTSILENTDINDLTVTKMKGLKTIKLVFCESGWSNSKLHEVPLLSKLCGFRQEVLTSECQVEVGFEKSCTLADKQYIASTLRNINLDAIVDDM